MTSPKLCIGPDTAPDRYRLLRSIGRGGEAVIHLAEIDLAGGAETVVVKVLDSKVTITSEEFTRISQKWSEQAELLRFVHRPGVVGVREHFEGPPIHRPGEASSLTGRSLVLVMNHVDGIDLRDWRTARDLSTPAGRDEVLRILERLAEVLDWLHSGRATPSGRQVIHGDLSPGNVMVDADGQPTLVDFGLSKLTAEHRTAEIWFTPGYAAPEVFDGRRTPGTDRYAFGALVYFLLSGESPPRTPGLLAKAMAALPQIAALDAERRTRVVALCAADPEQRPLSLAGWVQDVRQAVVSQRQDVQDVQDAVPPVPVLDKRRPRVALGAIAGVLVLAALAVVGVKLLGDNKGDDRDGANRVGGDRPTAPSPSPSSSPTPAASGPAGVSLTTLEPVAKSEYAWFETGSGTLGFHLYDTALVPAGPYKICDGSAAYDLGGGWKTLTMVAGVDDSSPKRSARINVEVDGSSVWTGELRVGAPKTLALDIANGRRLDISFEDPGRTCGMGRLVLGAPTLKK